MTSTMWTGSLTTAALSLPGQLTIAGTWPPPLVQRAFVRAKSAIGRWRLLAEAHAPARPAILLGTGTRGEQRVGHAAVVAREEDDRVVAQALLFECIDDAADLLVQGRDHARVGPPFLVLDGSVSVAVFLGRLIGCVGGQRREVEEERLSRVLGFDQLDRFVADKGRVVSVLLEEFAVALPVDQPAALFGEVIDLAHEVAVEVVEAAVLRPVLPIGMAEVPLAHHVGLVAGLFEGLGERALVDRQAVAVAREDHERLKAVTDRITARHQCGAGRGAHRHAVEGLASRARSRELVEIRRLDLAAAIAEVGVAEIVGHDEDDVRSLVWPRPRPIRRRWSAHRGRGQQGRTAGSRIATGPRGGVSIRRRRLVGDQAPVHAARPGQPPHHASQDHNAARGQYRPRFHDVRSGMVVLTARRIKS
jgi:hypothetical protein